MCGGCGGCGGWVVAVAVAVAVALVEEGLKKVNQ